MTQHPDPIGRDLEHASKSYDAAILRHLSANGHEAITLAETDVLLCIAENGCAMGQIASQRGVTKQAVQGQIQRLAERGYVKLKPDPNDARQKTVVRTKKGHDLVAALVTAQSDVHSALEAKLGVERLKNMRNMLAQARRALSL